MALLWDRRDNLKDRDTREKLGFLYFSYEGRCYYWELIVIVRLVIFAAVSLCTVCVGVMEARRD